MSQVAKKLENRYNATIGSLKFYNPNHHVNGFNLPIMPVITNSSPNELQFFNWGLIPSWVQNKEKAKQISLATLNAKSETVFEKPSFRNPILQKHCLVPADGFFEWMTNQGKKYPHYIYLKNEPIFSFAGIWEEWIDKNDTGEVVFTFSILTTEANPLMAKIHNTKKRMPLILPREKEQEWLSSNQPENIRKLLVPYPEENMEAHTISRLITSREVDTNTEKIKAKHVYEGLIKPGSLFD